VIGLFEDGFEPAGGAGDPERLDAAGHQLLR
jgi:hypothetical protein